MKKKQENNLVYTFDTADKWAVQHFLIYGSKKEAYRFAKMTQNEHPNETTLNTNASRYFNSAKIKLLLTTETEGFKFRLRDLFVKYGVKNSVVSDTNNFGIENLDQLETIDKSEAIRIIETLINQNRGNSKVTKELIPHLMKLKDWQSEKNINASNITLYELPKRE